MLVLNHIHNLKSPNTRSIILQELKNCKIHTSRKSRSHPNEGPRFFITRQDNPHFFNFVLDPIEIFDFYSTNRGDMIGVSQVVAYIECGGWEAFCFYNFTAPNDEIEVHHINGNTADNRPCNLVYLSRQDHQYVSNCTYTPFYGKVTWSGSTPFNRRGKPIKDPAHYLANIIKATLSCISIKHTGKKSDLAFSKILKALPKRLWQFAVNYYQAPRWLTSQLLHSLDPSFISP